MSFIVIHLSHTADQTSLTHELLNLGTTATIGVSIGGALIVLTLLACILLCLCRCFGKRLAFAGEIIFVTEKIGKIDNF